MNLLTTGIKNIRNSLDFWIRNRIKISRGAYCPKNEPKDGLFYDQELSGKEREFFEKYQLDNLKNNSTRLNYLENLYRIDILNSYLELNHNNNISILDIGSKNWFYAPAEWHFFRYQGFDKDINLTGIEIDPYRLYQNLYSRQDYAEYYIKNLENTRYIGQNLLEHRDSYDYITWFFPFVTQEPLLHWGLPLKCFSPEILMKKAYDLLKEGGRILIINQGIREYEIQSTMLDRLNIPYLQKGKFESIFLEYDEERFITIVVK